LSDIFPTNIITFESETPANRAKYQKTPIAA